MTAIRWGLPTLATCGLLVSCAGAVTVDVPVYPEPEDNAFDYYLRATELLPEAKAWDELAGQLEGADLVEVTMVVDEAADALEEFRLGVGKECVMPGDLTFDSLLPYLAQFRSLTRLLAVEGWMHREHGDFEAAFNSYMDAMKLGQDTARNGTLIHKLVSIACEAIACQQIRRAVGFSGGEQEALAALLARLETFEQTEIPLSETLAVEFGGVKRSIEKYKSDPEALKGMGEALGKPNLKVTPQVLDRGVSNAEAYYAQMIAVAKMDYWRWDRDEPIPRPKDPLVALIAPAVESARVTCTRHLANLRGTLLVAALELYFSRNGNYPEKLKAITLEILRELPVDPFSGEPFQYRLVDVLEYELYSVGPNMIDDGGLQQDRGDLEHDLAFSILE